MKSTVAKDNWASKTIVERSDIFDNIFEIDNREEDKLRTTRYCVNPGVDTLNFEPFFDFLRRNFKYFVFPKDKADSHDDAHFEAQKESDFKIKAENEGKYGELILFLLVEGLLDLPMISHKIAWKQSPSDEMKGSDGLFYGSFKGEKSLAIGEAKIKNQRSKAIKEALESTDRFHGGTGMERKNHELTVASTNLTDNLDQEQIKELSAKLTTPSDSYRTIHPMFVCYESAKISKAHQKEVTDAELKSEIKTEVSEYDVDNYIREKIEEDYSELKNHWVISMLMPVDDTEKFQERIQTKIYPYSSQ